jgi:hypothetical protein
LTAVQTVVYLTLTFHPKSGHHNVKFYVKLVYNAHCFAKDHTFLMIRAYHHPSQPSYELWKHDKRVFQHTVFLSEIKRQCDSTFIQTINEVSRGILSEDSIKYLSELNRPLDEKDSVKLFATNGLVDKYSNGHL